MSSKTKKNYKKTKRLILLGVTVFVASIFVTYVGLKLINTQKELPEVIKTPSHNQENNNQRNRKNEIDKIIDNMTTEEKVAQLFMVRVPEVNPQMLLEEYQFGGYIFFSNDFEGKSKQQIVEEINSYQTVSKIPIFIGTDEEGGEVNRLSPYFLDYPFPSSQQLYEEGGYNLIIQNTYSKNHFLKSFGINVNFAPVADVSTDPNDYIYTRSFGKNAEETSKYVKTVVTQMKKDKMGSVVKHFPGYGSNVNTHTSIAYDNRPYDQFEKYDFLPFKAAVQSGVDSILVSHNIVQSIDANYPASLSPKIHDVIRNTIGFDGVIITDDLIMQGASEFGSSGEVAVQAVIAGNDMILSSDAVVQFEAVFQAVKDGRISIEQVDNSVYRILEWKQSIGILNN